ncbi:MAG: DNA pilot protein [Microviridae sp.]|nr:MAG: DNA pilot protein [Microviridae sp.]
MKRNSHIAVTGLLVATGCTITINVQIERMTMPGEELIIGPILGQLMAGVNDQRQMAMQGRLMGQQVMAQKDLTEFNQKIALDTWEKTNYSAQMEQMKKAGLNPGLMYKQGGPGGSVAVTPGNVTGGQAPHGGGEQMMALQMAMQMKQTEADVELKKAQANLANTEAGKKGGVDTNETLARIDLMKQQTSNLQTEQEKTIYQTAIEKVRAKVAEGTQQAQITIGNMEVAEKALTIKMQEAGIIKVGADTQAVRTAVQETLQRIEKMRQDVAQGWTALDYREQEVLVKQNLYDLAKKETAFNTSTPKQMQQWINIVTGVAGSIAATARATE